MLMSIPLGKNHRAIIDEEDFIKVAQYSWHLTGQGYAAHRHRINGEWCRIIFMHRLIMDTPDHLVVDHIDRNKLNNSRSNLRLCTDVQNSLNRSVNSNSGTGVRGVRKVGKRYHTFVKYQGKRHNPGTFDTLDEAAHAVEEARAAIYSGGNYIRQSDGLNAREPGMQKGERVKTSKLSEDDVRTILERIKRGDRITHIAADYPVARRQINLIKSGKNWAHISRP